MMSSSHRVLAAVVAMLLMTAACGSSVDAEAEVRRIIEELSARQFGSATARYRQREDIILSPEAAPAWRRGLEHQDATVREWSVDSLARIGEAEDIPRLVSALDDPFRNVQGAAARSLTDADPDIASAAFLERLESNEPLRQTLAAQGLAGLGDASAAPALTARLADANLEAGVRGVIAQSLATLGNPVAVAPLATIAGSPAEDLELRRISVEALAMFTTEDATVALEGLLDSEDDYVQEVARRAVAGRR
jgi:HEAT repeat protein